MKRLRLLETKDIVCIVVLMILNILTILFVIALAIQHFVVDVLIKFTFYDHLSLNLTY